MPKQFHSMFLKLSGYGGVSWGFQGKVIQVNTPVGKIEKKSKWSGTQVFVRIDAAELNQHKYGLWLETDEVIEQSFLELAAKAVRELKSGQLLVLDVRGFDAYQGKKDLGSLGDMLHAEVFRATTKAHPFFVVLLCASRHLAYGFRNAHIVKYPFFRTLFSSVLKKGYL